MIFECGPQGADRKVCEHLARMYRSDIEISSVTLDRKPNLISECGKAAMQLFEDGCERVIIIWDLHPAWRERTLPPCRKEDRIAIFESLLDAGVTSPHVYLVCIEEELEAWLLADGRAISAYLSTPTHPVKIRDKKNPEKISNPKTVLNKLFQQHKGKGHRYSDIQHAQAIVEKIEDFSRLRRSKTFVRFLDKLG
ncbi:DUF4276 family protein [Anabaena cylindrica FACHB-243]|nr:DUF4276 family protein [Anabaena cylindrica FACHB-243]MBY5284162.1 DUF4276 family protein [Anabaena sp. CCAP 1446/1C]MBY5309321.1 DUF4276 family protein [Anabaena sp. CCAP 1446/1C]